MKGMKERDGGKDKDEEEIETEEDGAGGGGGECCRGDWGRWISYLSWIEITAFSNILL